MDAAEPGASRQPPSTFREAIAGRAKDEYVRWLHGRGALVREDGAWVVGGFEQAKAVLGDHARFSSDVMDEGFPMLTDDPPVHTELRRAMQEAFVPSAVEEIRSVVEEQVERLVAGLEAGRETDAVAELAAPLPAGVIAHMLQIEPAERDRFRRWADALTGQFGVSDEREKSEALEDLRSYFRRRLSGVDPCTEEGPLGAIARAREGDTVRGEERAEVVLALDLAKLMVVAGYETTANLIGSALRRLAAAPSAWDRLRAEPAWSEQVTEEVVRLDAPVQFVLRRAVEDVELDGRRIRQGDRVFVFLAAANRDPARWEEPGRFDPDRPSRRHVGFGHGIHYCLGAPLARMETRLLLCRLADRFSVLRPGDAPARRRPPGLVSGFRSLPLVFEP